jgi:hypothetical protein
MKYLILVFAISGLTLEPLASCPLCISHHGTCGCDMGHVVCCDGYDAYGCSC